jgi:hypothetical protein
MSLGASWQTGCGVALYYVIRQRIFLFYQLWINFSISTDGQSLFTDSELAFHRYWRTVIWRATLCHRNNANYLIIHQRTVQIYRWWIHFYIGNDGQSLFTDGELAYHRYRRYGGTAFWRATLCLLTNANYLIHQRTLQIYWWWIHSILYVYEPEPDTETYACNETVRPNPETIKVQIFPSI